MTIVSEKKHITVDALDILIILLLLFLVYSSHLANFLKTSENKNNNLIKELNNLENNKDDVGNILKDKPFDQ